MKYLNLLLILIFTVGVAKAQSVPPMRNNYFEKTVRKVLVAFEKQDAKILSATINHQIGFVLLYKNGTTNTYKRMDSIAFAPNYPYNILANQGAKFTAAKHLPEPEFNCDLSKYPSNTSGVYVSEATQKPFISHVISEKLKIDNDENTKDIDWAKAVEKYALRVVVIDADGNYAIFYLAAKAYNFYLVAIDLITNDCSA